MEILQPEQCSEDRKERHIELDDAVMNINSISIHLNELYERINGPTPLDAQKDSPDVKTPTPTLSDVLCSAPTSIREHVKEAHRIIDDISSSIF